MPPATAERPLAAIAAQLVCFTFISANDVIVKLIVAELPSWQIIAVRSGFGLALLAPAILWRLADGSGRLVTRRIGAHVLRAGLSAVSIVTYFEALRELDLPVATTILFVTPFFVVALSGLALRERVPANRWIAVVIGFAGALVIIKPDTSGISMAALLVVVSAATWAATMVAMRDMTRTESSLAIIVYFNLFLVIIAGSLAWPLWQPLSWRIMAIIACVAAIQLIAQQFMMVAFRLASASVTAPLQYVQLIWSVLAGWFIFGVIPALNVFAGAAIIVASGLYLILSERR
ncbi:DMT family transporter [Phreatobacter stygius]|nr:DMT family transporter [Phreatobacter stygius]